MSVANSIVTSGDVQINEQAGEESKQTEEEKNQVVKNYEMAMQEYLLEVQ